MRSHFNLDASVSAFASGFGTAPLAGLWTPQKGGFLCDARIATLPDVVNYCGTQLNLNLRYSQESGRAEYLKGV